MNYNIYLFLGTYMYTVMNSVDRNILIWTELLNSVDILYFICEQNLNFL